MRKQTQARELALKALYQHDLMGGTPIEELEAFCVQEAPTDVSARALALLRGCLEKQEVLDDIIRNTAENWKLERMATSDRNILRIGAYELLCCPDTPPKVAMNEAIEMAKRYSTENSPTFVNGVLDRIYNTHVVEAEAGGPIELRFSIEPDPQAKADLHLHSTASDGSHAPAALVAMAAKQGIQAIALTDHDTVDGIEAARKAGKAVGVKVIPGVEMTAYVPHPEEDTLELELHIAGLFINPESKALREKLDALRAWRLERIHRIAEKLGEAGATVQTERILAHAHGGIVGRAHVARELMAQKHCKTIDEAFELYLAAGRAAYEPKMKMTPAEVIAIIKDAGGCAVLCHPGMLPDAERIIGELTADGLDGLEVHYPAHTDVDEKRLMDLAGKLSLAVSGGSDFHGDIRPGTRVGQEAVSFVELHELCRRAGRSAARA